MTDVADEDRDDLERRAAKAADTLSVRTVLYEDANRAHIAQEDEDNLGELPRGEELSRAEAALARAEKVIDRLEQPTPVTETEAESIDTVLREIEADVEDLPADEEDDEAEEVLP